MSMLTLEISSATEAKTNEKIVLLYKWFPVYALGLVEKHRVRNAK